MGELLGAGIFVSTAVAGAVCLVRPFKIMERPFLRDVTFNIAAGYWAFCAFYRGQFYVYDAVGFLALYLVYIVVVVGGRFVNQKYLRRVRRDSETLIVEVNDHEHEQQESNASMEATEIEAEGDKISATESSEGPTGTAEDDASGGLHFKINFQQSTITR